MKFLLAIALILASMVFYSMGVILRAGKKKEFKPQIYDIVIILLLWAAAIITTVLTDLNRWVLFGGWAVSCIIIGFVVALFKKYTANPYERAAAKAVTDVNIFKKAWQGWKKFGEKLTGFQTRILFSLGFLVLISPIALIMKFTRDPLMIKGANVKSYWLARDIAGNPPEQYRKQS